MRYKFLNVPSVIPGNLNSLPADELTVTSAAMLNLIRDVTGLRPKGSNARV